MNFIHEAFSQFDYAPLGRTIVFVTLAYGILLIAMVIDLITGVRKAIQNGIARTSTLYKKTCDKAIKYLVPLLILTLIDFISCSLTPFPFFTIIWSMWCCWCEFKSVGEKYWQKKEMHEAAQTVTLIIKNKDDIAKLFSKTLNEMSEDDIKQITQKKKQ